MNKLFIICLILGFLPLTGQQLNFRKCASVCRSGGAAHPMQYRQIQNIHLLTCSAAFPNTTSLRANWDIPLNLNLAQTAGLRLRLLTYNPQLAGKCTIQLRTGGQWHSALLKLPTHSQWNDCFISKTDFTPENNQVSSWESVEMLRISIQNAIPGNFSLFFSKLEFVSPNASIALLQFNAASSTPAGIARALATQGLFPAVITQSDISQQLIRPYRLVLAPEIPPYYARFLADYSRYGGKLGLFHHVPAQLSNQLNWPTALELKGILFQGVTPAPHKLPGYQPIREKITSAFRLHKLPGDVETLAWLIAENEEIPPCPAALVNDKSFWMPCLLPYNAPATEGALLRALIASFIPDAHRLAAQTQLQSLQELTPFKNAGQPSDIRQQNQNQLNAAIQAFQHRQYNKTIHICQQTMISKK